MGNIRKEAVSCQTLPFVDSFHDLIFSPKTSFKREKPAGEKTKRQHLVVYFSIVLLFFFVLCEPYSVANLKTY